MLKFFTRLEKTRNFVLILFSVVMVGSLILFYAPTQNTAVADFSRSTEVAAYVGDEEITAGEVFRVKDLYSQMSQGRPYPARTAVSSLISTRVIRVEAERLGLTASDAEVAALIREQNKPADGTAFDQKIYEENVAAQYGSVAAFEQEIRDQISASKLRAFITSGVTVSEQEVLNDFQRKNTKFDLTYVTVNANELAQSIVPTDAELREYFEKNKAAYYISVPQKKIKYVFINTSKIGEKLPITDEELRAEYDALPADKKTAGVLGQEIVLRVAKPEFDGQVYEKATQLVARLKGDGAATVTEEAFAELAKGHSENAASAANGGKLPGPVRENLNNPTDPYQRLIKMKPGEITDPISYQGRYFILRRGEVVPKSFEEAKAELEVSLRNRRAYAAAAELAEKIAGTLKENKNVEATAAQYAAEANMTLADMIRETPYVKPGDNIENIGISPQFEQGIASLETALDVGDKTPIQNGFAIPMLVDKKEPRDAEFEEVKAQLVDVVKLEQARARVETIAKNIASAAGNAAGIAAAAQANDMKAADQEDFILGSPLGQGPLATRSDELEDAIYALRAGEATSTPIQIGETWYIVGVKDREEASMGDFAAQRDTLMQQMLQQKRGEVFSEYLAATRHRMETEGQIKIYDEVLAKLDAADQPAAPPTMPQGLPPGLMPEQQ